MDFGNCIRYLALLGLLCAVRGDITLDGTTKCGQFNCSRAQFCSVYHNKCEPCAGICNDGHHNVDATLCNEKCQDYLHDQRYALKNDPMGNEELRATVHRLSHMITILLALVCFILIILATVFSIKLYRWKKKKNITLKSVKKLFTKSPRESTTTKPTNQNVGKKLADLRLDITNSPSTQMDSPVTVTTSISRRPAEDSTLDYAYDNPAMSNSSSPTRQDNSRF